MKNEEVAHELAEELRTNVGLRRRLGMAEGDRMDVHVLEDDTHVVSLNNQEGETFFLAVQKDD